MLQGELNIDEPGLGGVTVYLDTNNNGVLDAGLYLQTVLLAAQSIGLSTCAQAALAGMLERVGLWGAALDWLGGKAYMIRNENLSKWVLGNTEKHCKDCLDYSHEAPKPAKVWARNDKLPQSPELECRGYNCDCRIENIETGEIYFP